MLAVIKSWPRWGKVIAGVAVLLVVAGGVTAVAAPRLNLGRASHPRSAARPGPTALPSATPTPEVSASPVPLVSALSCRLPISNGSPGSGGFVSFPSAVFSADPTSAVKADTFYGLTYDRAAGKWLPVARSAISPDGARYAYWEWRSHSMQSITVSTGSETTLGPKPNGAASAAGLTSPNVGWQILDAGDAGVYAAVSSGYQNTSQGLWLFPWSGAGENQVTGSSYWHAIGGGAAWGTVSPTVPEGAANTIIRLDLSGGSPADWFSRPGLHSRVVGFDLSGHPVVEASSKDVTEVWIIGGQSSSTKLLTVPAPTQQGQNGPGPGRAALESVVGDANGIWLATTDGLYLAVGDRVEKVSTVTGQLGGGCAPQ